MRVAVTGASGLIGSALVPRLREGGDEVIRLVRGLPSAADEAQWDPDDSAVTARALSGVDALVHLAGEPIGALRWTDAKKERILSSRVEGTASACAAVAQLDDGPRVVVSASGMDYYGDRGDEILTEDSAPGDGFLSLVCRAWEAAADPARTAGARVVHLRTAMVLSRNGGALPKLLPLFRLGLGGRFGSGMQWWSWITLDDMVAVIERALTDEQLSGPVNAAAPNPVTNAEFTTVLAHVLRRPALLPVPAFGPRLLVGRELADTLLLKSARMVPAKLEAMDHQFQHADLETGLRAVLNRPSPDQQS